MKRPKDHKKEFEDTERGLLAELSKTMSGVTIKESKFGSGGKSITIPGIGKDGRAVTFHKGPDSSLRVRGESLELLNPSGYPTGRIKIDETVWSPPGDSRSRISRSLEVPETVQMNRSNLPSKVSQLAIQVLVKDISLHTERLGASLGLECYLSYKHNPSSGKWEISIEAKDRGGAFDPRLIGFDETDKPPVKIDPKRLPRLPPRKKGK